MFGTMQPCVAHFMTNSVLCFCWYVHAFTRGIAGAPGYGGADRHGGHLCQDRWVRPPHCSRHALLPTAEGNFYLFIFCKSTINNCCHFIFPAPSDMRTCRANQFCDNKEQDSTVVVVDQTLHMMVGARASIVVPLIWFPGVHIRCHQLKKTGQIK